MSNNTRISLVAAILLALCMTISGKAETTPESPPRRWEGDMKKSKAGVFLSMAKRLPGMWSLRRKARRILPTLPDYEGEIQAPDSDLIYSWIEDICKTPHRRPGTPQDHVAEIYIADKFRGFDLENVTMDPVPITLWEADRWSLTVDNEKIDSFYVPNTGFTGPDGVTAPMVYVGTGRPKDFEGKDVAGKIVVADVPFPVMNYGMLLRTINGAYAVSDPEGNIKHGSKQYLNFVRMNFIGGTTAENAPPDDVYWNAQMAGAAGICLILKDQPSNSNTHYGPYDGIMKPMPALWIGKYDGMILREAARSGREATLMLEGTKKPGVMHNVWGVLPGMSDEVILVTSHHDSPFEGAIEDGAGSAQVLAQAWAWSKVPREQRPKTMVFVIDGGHFYGSHGAHQFARDHKDIMERTRILITLEHLGAEAVEEVDREYSKTGKLALTVMFTSNDPTVIATVMKAYDKTKPKMTASVPADIFGPVPTSDAAGYVAEAGVPVISWIGCPYYLLDAHDTLDKVRVEELKPIAETVIELVGTYMAMD